MTPLRIYRTRHGYQLADALTGAPLRSEPYRTRKSARIARAVFQGVARP